MVGALFYLFTIVGQMVGVPVVNPTGQMVGVPVWAFALVCILFFIWLCLKYSFVILSFTLPKTIG